MLQPAPYVYDGLCELFELFLVHVFASFSGVRLTELVSDRALARVTLPPVAVPMNVLSNFCTSHIHKLHLHCFRMDQDSQHMSQHSAAPQ